MSDAAPTRPAPVHRLRPLWAAMLVWAAVLGVVAAGYGVGGLLGLPVDPGRVSAVEHAVALAAGLGLTVFGVTALRHARATVADGEFRRLAFGPWCRARATPVAAIRRLAVGWESTRHGRRAVLLLELDDARRESVLLSMYRDWRGLVAELEAASGLAAGEGETGFLGARFRERDRA